MPASERYVFDLHTPHPNVDIDTMRQAIVQAIAEVETNAAGLDDTYWLSDLLFTLLGSALAEAAQLRADLSALADRLAELEPAPPTEEA
ncbi:hypothetical protein [Blastococcus sp. CCUG 61487]|uniref:hypothetical protein n=1 Tax=Blastococcus sp. CCUG 61487 TaxID=1840703 RepID=UPI0010C08F30|nr:hypothetical protein [Blastococcus sp. CCUG 61487]TKJ24371.1 hypothetical protein A6V29_05070 [Blastococcus sp. CCUG 61487]